MDKMIGRILRNPIKHMVTVNKAPKAMYSFEFARAYKYLDGDTGSTVVDCVAWSPVGERIAQLKRGDWVELGGNEIYTSDGRQRFIASSVTDYKAA